MCLVYMSCSFDEVNEDLWGLLSNNGVLGQVYGGKPRVPSRHCHKFGASHNGGNPQGGFKGQSARGRQRKDRSHMAGHK